MIILLSCLKLLSTLHKSFFRNFPSTSDSYKKNKRRREKKSFIKVTFIWEGREYGKNWPNQSENLLETLFFI